MTTLRFFSYRACITLLSVSFLVFSVTAKADTSIKKLTDKNVTHFIETTTDMTSNNPQNLSAEQIHDYLNTHIADEARFKSIVKFHIPNMPVQKKTLNLNKAEFINSAHEGVQTVKGMKI